MDRYTYTYTNYTIYLYTPIHTCIHAHTFYVYKHSYIITTCMYTKIIYLLLYTIHILLFTSIHNIDYIYMYICEQTLMHSTHIHIHGMELGGFLSPPSPPPSSPSSNALVRQGFWRGQFMSSPACHH